MFAYANFTFVACLEHKISVRTVCCSVVANTFSELKVACPCRELNTYAQMSDYRLVTIVEASKYANSWPIS